MTEHILIAETRDIIRVGLRDILSKSLAATQISEIATLKALKESLSSNQFDMIIINQTLVTDLKLLPRRHFCILAAMLTRDLLLAAYAAGACGYLSEHTSEELLIKLFRLQEDAFLLDPLFVPQLLRFFYLDSPSAILSSEELTARELEVFKLICTGATNRFIADELHISETTVKTHVIHIFQKLRIKRRQIKAAF